MNTFKVGDKIVFYWTERKMGFIQSIQPSGMMVVSCTDSPMFYHVHPKQCRRLVKKPRREFWIIKFPPEGQLDERVTYRRVNSEEPPYPESLNYIHVREVVEKK